MHAEIHKTIIANCIGSTRHRREITEEHPNLNGCRDQETQHWYYKLRHWQTRIRTANSTGNLWVLPFGGSGVEKEFKTSIGSCLVFGTIPNPTQLLKVAWLCDLFRFLINPTFGYSDYSLFGMTEISDNGFRALEKPVNCSVTNT